MKSRAWQAVLGAIPVVLIALLAPGARAATATWSSTGAATEYWTNAANWNATPYPGADGVNQAAFLTNPVGGVYAAVVDTTLPNALGTVEIKNLGGGEAWVAVTNAVFTSTNLLVRAQGRLEIDNQGVVTNTLVTLDNSGGQIWINRGGALYPSTNLTIGTSTLQTNVLTMGDASQLILPTGCTVTVTGMSSNFFAVTGSNVFIQTYATPSFGNALFTGEGTVWDGKGQRFYEGSSAWKSNTITVSHGSLTMTNTPNGFYVGYSTGNGYNSLVVTNGGRLYTKCQMVEGYNGYGGNVIVVTGTNSLWDDGGSQAKIGSDNSTNNQFWVDQGGTVSNATAIVGMGAGSGADRLVITNGGRWYVGTATYPSAVGYFGANHTAVVTGTGTVWDAGTRILNVGGATITGYTAGTNWNNTLTLANGAMITNGAIMVGNASSGGLTFSNSLVVTNGGQLFGLATTAGAAAGVNYVGNLASSNEIVITGPGSLWNCNTQSITVGTGVGVCSNVLRIENGAVVTNAYTTIVGTAGAVGNGFVLANGAQFWNYLNDFQIGSKGTNNWGWVGGNGALLAGPSRSCYSGTGGASGSVFTVDSGGTIAYYKDIFVGRAAGTMNCTLIVTNGGHVLSTDTIRVGYDGNNTFNNVLLVVNGGLLEGGRWWLNQNVVGPVGGNAISNVAGIYQFFSATPTIAVASNDVISLTDGTLSFRDITNADVRGIWNGAVTNITFAGRNGFRLNDATNWAAGSQAYVFDDFTNATNYARLEMVNGGTRYHGKAGDALTIGPAGRMLCSNTTATVDLPYTNNGALTIVRSTLTFLTNAVLNGTLTIDLDHLANTNGVLAADSLTLGTGSVLNLAGTFATNMTLVTYTGTLGGIGQFGATVGLPTGYLLQYGGGAVVLKKSQLNGTTIVIR